jgi:hypothetical protein
MEPMTRLLKKEARMSEWGPEQDQSFQETKEAIVSAPVLRYPDPRLAYVLIVDASKLALGAALGQTASNGLVHIVAYASKKLTPTQSRYSATERECLGIVWAVNHFKRYIHGVRFKIVTDARALKWLFSVRDTNDKLLRWSILLQEQNMSITHRPGVINVADGPSRLPAEEPDTPTEVYEHWPDGSQVAAAHIAAVATNSSIPLLPDTPSNKFLDDPLWEFTPYSANEWSSIMSITYDDDSTKDQRGVSIFNDVTTSTLTALPGDKLTQVTLVAWDEEVLRHNRVLARKVPVEMSSPHDVIADVRRHGSEVAIIVAPHKHILAAMADSLKCFLADLQTDECPASLLPSTIIVVTSIDHQFKTELGSWRNALRKAAYTFTQFSLGSAPSQPCRFIIANRDEENNAILTTRLETLEQAGREFLATLSSTPLYQPLEDAAVSLGYPGEVSKDLVSCSSSCDKASILRKSPIPQLMHLVYQSMGWGGRRRF